MTANSPSPSVSVPDYQLRLPGYEGPLDVLLRLIERDRLEITDVSLVAVTSQFLAFVDDLEEAPADVVAGFTTVGSRLTVLKSRSLLPRPVVVDEDDEPSDLTRQLLEYRLAKEASAFLQQQHDLDRRMYTRTRPYEVDTATRISAERLANYPASLLVQAIRRRLTVVPTPARLIPRRRIVSLRQTVRRILDVTSLGKRVPFSHVVQDYVSRTEVATAFLGMLVLIRRNTISASQTDMFGEIELDRQAGAPLGVESEDIDDIHS